MKYACAKNQFNEGHQVMIFAHIRTQTTNCIFNDG